MLADQDLPLGRIRITFTGGPAPLGSGRGDDAADPGRGRGRDGGLARDRPRWRRCRGRATSAAHSPASRPRRTPRTSSRWPRAAERGATEAVFANLAGHLCEGTGSNVFYVVDGELRTPTLASGCLAGVTRALVLEWYGGREVDEPIEVVERASEVFLVSTTRDVQGVSRWDDVELPAPGPVTREVAAVWREREPELLGED